GTRTHRAPPQDPSLIRRERQRITKPRKDEGHEDKRESGRRTVPSANRSSATMIGEDCMGPARTRRLCSATALALLVVALHVRGFAAGAPRVSRTPDGPPDLQGISDNSKQTPLQRPAALGSKQFYTDEELASLRLRDHDRDGLANGDRGTYNEFWWEEGGFLRQTSLIVDPPNGRIPPLTPDGERRRAEFRARGDDRSDNPEERNLAERCITRSVPKLPGGYNNNFQIVQ